MAFPTRSAFTLVGAVACAALLLTGCSPSGTDNSAPEATDAKIAPPAIIKAGILTVCTGDSPPNIFYDENNDLQGVEIDIAKALSDELGLMTTLGEYAFAGLIPALQAQQCDVIMGSLYIKPEREEVANFVPYLYSGTAVATSKENPEHVTGFDDSLCGLNIVAITGATGAVAADERSAACEDAGKKALNISLVDEGTNALQQVIAGQAEAFIDTSEIVNYYERESDGEVQMTGDPFGKIQIGAASLKNNDELTTALDGAFQSIIDNGKYADILAKWGVESNDITQPE